MNCKPGDVVQVRFWDHTEDWGGLADITVWGRVVEADGKCLTVDSWAPTDPAEKRRKKANDRKTFYISAGSMIEYAVLSKSAHKGR